MTTEPSHRIPSSLRVDLKIEVRMFYVPFCKQGSPPILHNVIYRDIGQVGQILPDTVIQVYYQAPLAWLGDYSEGATLNLGRLHLLHSHLYHSPWRLFGTYCLADLDLGALDIAPRPIAGMCTHTALEERKTTFNSFFSSATDQQIRMTTFLEILSDIATWHEQLDRY